MEESNETFIPSIKPPILGNVFTQEKINGETASPALKAQSRTAAPKIIRHYWVPQYSVARTNGCGQAAMATILTYWGKMGSDPYNPEMLYNNPASKPDVLFGLFGTSWERFQQVLSSYGLAAQGQNEGRLTVNSAQGKYETLCNWVNAGLPVAVILGNGELGYGAGAHWYVVVETSPDSVKLANNGSTYLDVDVPTFMKAWEAYGLPGVHYAGVFAQG